MNYTKIIAAMIIAFVFNSCNDNKQQDQTPATETVMQPIDSIAPSAQKVESFSEIIFENTKDVVCGMPISAGVSDTIHYKGKVYGFCATECKDEFLKDPKQYLSKK